MVAEQRYLPYGEARWVSGTLMTDLQFTGQRDETGLGLMDYRARFYSSRLGRFVSADSVVPGIGSLSLNRYMYVSGSPIRYNDPSGHARPTDESENYSPGIPYPGLPGWYEAGRAYQAYLKAKCDYAEHPDNEDYARQLESAQAGFELFRSQARMAMPMTLWTEDNVASLYEGAGTVGIGMVSSLSGGPEDSGIGGIPESLRRDVLGDPDCVGCGYQVPGPTSSILPLGKGSAERTEHRTPFTPDQDALIQLSKDAKRRGALSIDEAETLMEWADELGIPEHGPEIHPNRNFTDWHIHIGPVGKIPIEP